MFIEDKINIENQLCLFCSEKMDVSYKKVSLDQPNIDQKIYFYAPILSCKKCKSSEVAPEFNDIQHEASCYANEVLNAKEIKKIRNEIKKIEPWGSNNQDFSLVLGFGSSTIARYETCKSVPSMTHSNAIKAVLFEDYRENVIKKSKPYRQYLERSKTKKSKSKVGGSRVIKGNNIIPFPTKDLYKIFKIQHIEKSLEINMSDEESFIATSFPVKQSG